MRILGYQEPHKELILPFSNSFILKNNHLEIISMSDHIFHKIGLKKSEDTLGFTDYDTKCPSSIHADRFRAQDRLALHSSTPTTQLDILHYCDTVEALITIRTCTEEKNVALNIFNLPTTQYTLLKIDIIRESILNKKNSNWKSYTVLAGFPHLNQVESMVLFHLIRGKTVKKIAHLLSHHPNEIEAHTRNMQLKFNCNSLPELIEFSLHFSYDEYIPLDFLGL